jgi:hypothetical protein
MAGRTSTDDFLDSNVVALLLSMAIKGDHSKRLAPFHRLASGPDAGGIVRQPDFCGAELIGWVLVSPCLPVCREGAGLWRNMFQIVLTPPLAACY